MKKLKSQSGRSMVEMLGVLAIIGVLSVGGIAGYSLSMRRHRANGVVDYVSKLAVGEYGRCQKHLLDGNIDVISNCTNFGPTTSFFSDRDDIPDVGAIPAGVEDIIFSHITTDDNGQDFVQTEIGFTDKKLCQTVASVVGSKCEYNFVQFKIKQN